MVVWSLDNLLAADDAHRKGGRRRRAAARRRLEARQPGLGRRQLLTSNAASGHTARPVYRNGSLWDVESVQRTVSGETVSAVRWMQLNVSTWPATPTFVQDQFIATSRDSDHFYPAIMADASNNAFIVYGRSSTGGEFASAYVTGRTAADPVNTLRAPAPLQAGTSALSVTNPAAYGRYFGAALDPDDGTVWVVGEYVASATGVGRVGGQPLGAAAADGHQAGQRHGDGDQRTGRDHLSDRLHRVLSTPAPA